MVTPRRSQRRLVRRRSSLSACASCTRSLTPMTSVGSSASTRRHHVAGLGQHRHDVGQVALARTRSSGDAAQRRREQAAAKAVDAGRDLGDRPLVVGRFVVIDEADNAIFDPPDPREPVGLRRARGQNGDGRAEPIVLFGECSHSGCLQQGCVARQHQHVGIVEIVVTGKRGQRGRSRVARAQGTRLLDVFDVVNRTLIAQLLFDLIAGSYRRRPPRARACTRTTSRGRSATSSCRTTHGAAWDASTACVCRHRQRARWRRAGQSACMLF